MACICHGLANSGPCLQLPVICLEEPRSLDEIALSEQPVTYLRLSGAQRYHWQHMPDQALTDIRLTVDFKPSGAQGYPQIAENFVCACSAYVPSRGYLGR